MILIPKSARLPVRCDDDPDPMVRVKLFTPYSDWTWLLYEYDPEDKIAFGFAYCGHMPDCAELGSVYIPELEALRGPGGIPGVERDLHWQPCRLSEAKRRERMLCT